LRAPGGSSESGLSEITEQGARMQNHSIVLQKQSSKLSLDFFVSFWVKPKR